MPKLYELVTAFYELEKLADNPETNDEQISLWLDECGGALQEKAVNIAMFVENLEATASAIENAEKNMAQRRKAIENRIKSIKNYVLFAMKSADVFKIEAPEFVLRRQNNPPAVVIDDETKIALEYFRQPPIPPPAIDKKLILDHIKNGVCVDGAHLEQTERLVIK